MKNGTVRLALKKFLLLFPPLALLTLAVLFSILHVRSENRLSTVSISERALLDLLQAEFETELAAHAKDAQYLAALAARVLGKEGFTFESKAVLRDYFLDFSKAQGVYDQVRILNAQGMEKVRIDLTAKGPKALPAPRMQNKSTRPYFRHGMQTKCEHVYVSRFDLNQEFGVLQLPLKPVIRFASPVSSPDGGKQGVVVLNYLGQRLLQRIRSAESFSFGRVLLVNKGGFWLVGLRRQDEWGFQLQGSAMPTFESRFPTLWRKIKASPRGQFQGKEGLFTFTSAKVLDDEREKRHNCPGGWQRDEWHLVSWVGSENLKPAWLSQVWGFTLTILAILALAGWALAWVSAQRELSRRALRESEELVLAISHTVQDAVAMIDSQDRVLFWNPSAERLFGYLAEEVMGKPLHPLLAGEQDSEIIKHKMVQFAKSGRGEVFGCLRELHTRDKNGRELVVELSASSLKHGEEWVAVGILRDVTQRKKDEERLRELATTDELTGVCNRRRFMELAERAVAHADRYQEELALLMLDLDHFKAVNDNHGHQVGDQVLQVFAKTCSACLREVDCLGRVGGEEFAVLLPQTNREGALQVAARLREAVAAIRLDLGSETLVITMSAGLAVLGKNSLSLRGLIKQADAALYRAKDLGRNRVEVFREA